MTLQEQIPLSPKKFLKKILEKFFPWAIIFFVLEIGLIFFVYFGVDEGHFLHIGFLVWSFLVMILILVLAFIPYAIYVRAYIRSYFYDANENFITIRKGVFAPTEIHVQFQKIQDVYVDQDIIDRVLGLYDVHIASATVSSGIAAHIDGVEQAQAEALKNLLLQKIQSPHSGASTSETTPPIPQPISAEQQVSSDQFPISGRWLYSSTAWTLIHTTYISVIAVFLLFNDRGHGDVTLSESFGMQWGWGWVFLILFVVVGFTSAHILWLLFWRKNYRFEFSPEYLLLRSGVISREEKHVPYATIQNVTMKQGIVDRVFGLSSVTIENAASGQQIIAKNKQNPSAIVIPGQPVARADQLVQIVNDIIKTKANPGAVGL